MAKRATARTAAPRAGYGPCLGGCGAVVGEGQKCPPCATEAVAAFLVRRAEREREQERINGRKRAPLAKGMKKGRQS